MINVNEDVKDIIEILLCYGVENEKNVLVWIFFERI